MGIFIFFCRARFVNLTRRIKQICTPSLAAEAKRANTHDVNTVVSRTIKTGIAENHNEATVTSLAPEKSQRTLADAGTPDSFCTSRRALRVVRQLEQNFRPDCAGRMVISGRMADVCAELDRLAAMENCQVTALGSC